MGDRISVSFRRGSDTSVTLFSHWQGMDFVERAKKHVSMLKDEARKNGSCYPLDRLEVQTVMVDFISREVARGERVPSDYYIGATPHDGDNSDNGHWVVDLNTGVAYPEDERREPVQTEGLPTVEVLSVRMVQGAGNLRAFVDICIDRKYCLNRCVVMDGRRGAMAWLPRMLGKDGRWFDVVFIGDEAIKGHIERAILQAYEAEVAKTGV